MLVWGGGAFYGFIQPLLPCKLVMSSVERSMRVREKKHFVETYAYQNAMLEQIPNLIDDLKSKMSDCDFVFDLNKVVRDCPETLFESNWVHLNAKGNAMIAKAILEILKL